MKKIREWFNNLKEKFYCFLLEEEDTEEEEKTVEFNLDNSQCYNGDYYNHTEYKDE